MSLKTEEKLRQGITQFVATLDGRYKDHCSDTMLAALLFRRMTRDAYKIGTTRAEAAIHGQDPNATYDAAQPIFENILEHECSAGGNGHHVAQRFGAHMDSVIKEIKG